MPKSTTKNLVAIVVVAAALTLAGGLASGSDRADDARSLRETNARALEDAYLVTLTLIDGDDTYRFSTVTASRRFSLSPPERRFEFHGKLDRQPSGRELLDFRVEFQQRFVRQDAVNEGAYTRVGSWTGSTYIDAEGSLPIIENPNSRVSVKMRKLGS